MGIVRELYAIYHNIGGKMSPQDQQLLEFTTMVGQLLKLVTISIILERSLAFVYEHKWFLRFFGKQGYRQEEGQSWESWFPGIKATIAIGLSLAITFYYCFDLLQLLFNQCSPSLLGKVITALTIAGGSNGAIAIFQGYLKLGKEARDATIAANKAKTDAEKAAVKSANILQPLTSINQKLTRHTTMKTVTCIITGSHGSNYGTFYINEEVATVSEVSSSELNVTKDTSVIMGLRVAGTINGTPSLSFSMDIFVDGTQVNSSPYHPEYDNGTYIFDYQY